MSPAPHFDEIIAVLSAASAGNTGARVVLPDYMPPDDPASRVASAVNQLLDSVVTRAANLEAAHRTTQTALERVISACTAQLRQSEDKFAKAFRASPAAISISSLPDGRWLEVNDALAGMTGYRPEELLGRTSLELGLIDAKSRAKILEALRLHGAVRNVEVQLCTKFGTTIDVLLSAEQIELDGQWCALTIQYDITELKRALHEVHRLNHDLEQRQRALEGANRELEAFSYSVAHDLRAPLRSIDGFSRALLEDSGERLDAAGQRQLQRVRHAAEEMSRLIDDLLTLSRVTRSQLRCEPVNLSALARSILERRQSNDPGRQVEIVVADRLVVEADDGLMAILLENLLGNAWKFTGKRAAARIEVGIQRVGQRSVYYVRDNGVGFDMAYAEKLFGVFQRLHSDTEFEGTGIGLATAQRIVRRHGGEVWAEGEVGCGATFYFTLNEDCE